MTNTPKTAESSVSHTATKADGRRVRILSARSAGILALVLATVVFAIDQGTKYLVVTQMQLGERITVIDGLLWWYSIRNSGAAFSMGENVTWVFTLVMVAAAAVVLYLLRRTRALSWTLALGGLLGGICGNLLTVSSASPASAPVTWLILFPCRTSRFSILQTPQSACAWRSSFC